MHSNITFKWNFRHMAIDGSSCLIELTQSLGAEEKKNFEMGLGTGDMMYTHTHLESGMRNLSWLRTNEINCLMRVV